ncbi:MFS general substrate transporter [Aspergillus phoenicis ATCC 13157]|uniref:MFS general substrate transporter n=1 Tax=Aspergillus phoenicis ATCC 13157 TaxID=1353007 RepID=A0A370PPZ7_ASPPH|nr:MFS general substrate transporter [Aspergillus phoenicis ATCC 13157]
MDPKYSETVVVESHNDKVESTQDVQGYADLDPEELKALETRIRWKTDLRLCTIAGTLCSLNLLDSGILSSASVTSMPDDLDLIGTRYSVSVFIFTIASVVFQLPSTIAVRWVGPRIWFACIAFAFGLITMCTAFIHTWKEMIALRVLLGMSMSGIYPGLTYLISAWYPRREQQLRFALMQSGEVIGLATGYIVNYGLELLDGRAGMQGWRWMYLVQGLISCVIGIATYWWIIDFPENVHRSFCFMSELEARVAAQRIKADRDDIVPDPFSWRKVLAPFADPKLYGFACMYFLLNLVSTALNYFLPMILEDGMGFSSNDSILLSTPPYYWAVIPVIFTSFVGDRYRIRGPLIAFNALCLIAGFLMFGLPSSTQVTVRYIGTFLATGAYVSNWAALNAFMANNVVGQWNRATTAAAVSACNGLGGVAGSYIVRQQEAPRYETAVWVSIGSHILMIALVCVFTLFFWHLNRQQKHKGRLIQNMVGFRYTY